jgi:hypothetical protein
MRRELFLMEKKKWDATALRALSQALDVPKYDRKHLSPPHNIL